MGHIHRLNPIGSATAPLANWTLRQPAVPVAAGEGRRDRPAPDPAAVRPRPLPPLVPPPRGRPAAPGRAASVVLLDDCFTTYNNPEVGRAAVRVLEAAGYRVELAGLRCCGRPAISKGLLTLGRDLARENVREARRAAQPGHADRRLRAELPADPGRRVPRLPPRPRRRPGRRGGLAGRRLRRRPRARARPAPAAAARAGPCSTATASRRPWWARPGRVAALRRIPGLEVRELDSGCCGMAGSFGYEGPLRGQRGPGQPRPPARRRRRPRGPLVAPGFSCRSQVHGLAGLSASIRSSSGEDFLGSAPLPA